MSATTFGRKVSASPVAGSTIHSLTEKESIMTTQASTIITGSKPLAPINPIALKQLIPAAFASKPKPGVSEQYKYIDTMELTKELSKAGLVPVEARQYAMRDRADLRYGRHMLKF